MQSNRITLISRSRLPPSRPCGSLCKEYTYMQYVMASICIAGGYCERWRPQFQYQIINLSEERHITKQINFLSQKCYHKYASREMLFKECTWLNPIISCYYYRYYILIAYCIKNATAVQFHWLAGTNRYKYYCIKAKLFLSLNVLSVNMPDL